MKSILQLTEEAKDYSFNPVIPLKIYLKTCVGLLDKAQLNFQNGDIQLSYMFYYRYVDLCTNKISKHPEFLSKSQDPEVTLYKQEYLQLIKLEVPAVLKIIEDLQRQIDLDYNKHQLSLAKNIARKPINNNMQKEDHSNFSTLPSTFNEHRFNQSISYFQKSNVTNTVTPSSSVQPSNISFATNNTNAANQNSFQHYPELPQLSFPTY